MLSQKLAARRRLSCTPFNGKTPAREGVPMRRFTSILILVVLSTFCLPVRSASAREICFPGQPQITACFPDPFSGYWETNGGLPVFGYPLQAARQERNPDLNVNLLTQWTERNRLEVHP